MPDVNGTKFPYTPSGKKAAKAFAKKTGQKMKDKKPSGVKMGMSRFKGGM